MWRLTLTMMKKNVRMLVPAGIAVVISTMFITCSLIFGDAMSASIKDQVTAGFGNANWVMTAQDHEEDPDWQPTVGTFDLDRARAIVNGTSEDGAQAKLAGVRADVQISARLVSGNESSNGVAISPGSNSALLPVTISEGRQPKGDNEVAIPADLAQRLHISLGKHVAMEAAVAAENSNTMRDVTRQVTVVGLTEDPYGAYGYYGGAMVLSENTIAALRGKSSFNNVACYRTVLDISGSPAVQQEAVDRLKRELPVQVESRDAVAEASMKAMTGDSNVTKMFLLCFGALALVVAALVIANTFQVLVAQRRRTFALLRIVGARTDQVYRSVVFESLILGAVSSALGVGAGVDVMELVAQSGVLGSMVHLRVVLTVWTFVVPIVFGTLATIVASLGAARMATRVTPLEAMRPMEAADQSATHRGRATLGTIMMLAGIALAIFAMRHVDQNSAMLAAMAGCALLFIGTAVTARFWLPWLMKGLGALASHCGPSAKLAAANISKNPRRVAATGTALLIGVTLVATMGTGAACAKQTMDTALATRYSTDVVITDVPQNQADKLATRIKGQEGVRNVLAAPVATVSVKGQVPAAMKEGNVNTTVRLLGVPDIKALSGVLNVDCSHLKLDADTVILPEYLPANGKKLDTGAHISVSEQDDASPSAPATLNLTPQTLDFRGVLPYGATAGFVDQTLFNNGTLQAGSAILLISIDQHSAVPMSDIMDTLHNDIASIPAAQLVGPVAEKQQWDQMVDMMLMLLVVLLAVAVIIALIGVANTLSLSVIERTRESATLRAIGMTKEQLRASLGIEACLITLVASIAGLLLGTAFGALGTYMVMKPAVGSYSFATDWRVDIAILVIAILAALAASIGPARRANKVPPVEALAEN